MIVVLTDQPFRMILHWLDTSGKMAKWTLKLFEFDLAFHPGLSIKVQVPADFLIKCIIPEDLKKDT